MSTGQDAAFRGECLAPYYDMSLFPTTGGFIDGRFCFPGTNTTHTCCLPCPTLQWLYDDSMEQVNVAAAWMNIVSFILLGLSILSFICLPKAATRAHYLTYGLMISVMFMNMAFTIAYAANPNQCYNEITPNDMYSSMACAWSGAFIVAGGLFVVFWIMLRSLSMHLQICWDITPETKFFYIAQVLGWGVPAALFISAMTASGVSFRFSQTCLVNASKSMLDYWGWLIAVAALTILLQLTSFAYCLYIYLQNLRNGEPVTTHASQGRAQAYPPSDRTYTVRAVWSRLKRVLAMQWRGTCLVIITLANVVFLSTVFVYTNDTTSGAAQNMAKATPWLECLAESGGNKYPCLQLGQDWLVNQETLTAVLIMLSQVGLVIFLICFRFSMIKAWVTVFRGLFTRRQDFVSLDPMRKPPTRHWEDQDQKQTYIPTSPSLGGGSSPVFEHPSGYEMQSPTAPKEYGDVDTATICSSTLMNSPVETSNGPLQYGSGWGRRTPDTKKEFYSASPTPVQHPNSSPYNQSQQYPQRPPQPYIQPDSSAARSQDNAARAAYAHWGLLPPEGSSQTASPIRHQTSYESMDQPPPGTAYSTPVPTYTSPQQQQPQIDAHPIRTYREPPYR